MSASSAGQRRGRQVAARKRSSMTRLYWVLGAVVILVAAFLVAFAALRGGGDITAREVKAPVGNIPEGMSYTNEGGQTINLPAGLWYKGDPNAPVKIIEYADYQCPSCASFTAIYEDSITRNYVETGRVQLIYHEFPLQQHANAVPAAEAARCAGDQGKYWQMHDTLYSKQTEWESDGNAVSRFAGYAAALGMDRGAFESCMAADKHLAAVNASGAAAQAANIQATPTFYVNGKKTDASNLKQAIDAALQGK
jgi:predicted DsbA family dithiol-disulfide isomerase